MMAVSFLTVLSACRSVSRSGRSTAHIIEWDWEYDGSLVPEEALPTIEFRGTPEARELRNGVLRIVNAPDPKGPWGLYVIRGVGALNSRGVTVEARIRMVSSGGEHAQRPGLQLFASDSHCAEALLVCDGYLETRYSLLRHAMDTTSDFHTYRLAARGDDYRVYVDGKLAINGKGRYLGTRTNQHQGTWLDTVEFGSVSPWSRAQCFMDSFRYTTKGAFAPNGKPDAFSARPVRGRKVEIEPVQRVLDGMAAGLNDFDPTVPQLGGTVDAPVLHDGPSLQVWLQNPTTKVFRRDVPAATRMNREISISLARNEYEPFQVVLRPKVTKLRSVRLEFSDLVGEGARIGKEHLSANPLAYLHIPADNVTAARGKQIGRPGYWPDGLLPYRSFDIENVGINCPVWVTLYCPSTARPGVYRGTITVKAESIPDIVLSLSVRVREFILPREPRLNVHFLFNNVYCSIEKSMEVYKRMYRDMARHRGSPSRLFPGLKVEIHDGKVWVDPENEKFVEMARYCIDELGLRHFWFPHIGPHQMLGWFEQHRKGRRWMGVEMYEDKSPYLTFTPEFEERFVDYLKQASAFLKSKGLFEAFNCVTSHNEPACPPAWRSARSFAAEARYCDLVHKADPGLKVFMNMALVVGSPELDLIKDKVSIWAENTIGSTFKFEGDDEGRIGFITPQLIRERQAAGDEVLIYRNSHDYIDTGHGHSAMNHRANGWIMWVTGTTGYYFDNGGISASLWNANAWRTIGRKWWGEMQWGAADQMYPSENMCGFYPSIRFELTREAAEDYEYLATLGQLANEVGLTPAQEQVLRDAEKTIVPLYYRWRAGTSPDGLWEEGVSEGRYETDARKLHEARERIGDLIDEFVVGSRSAHK